jgi:dethiobiotin synthetase
VSRPGWLVVVTATGTEVGKTWVGARVLERLRARGRRVAARKPAQSFEPGRGPTDADVLAAATGEDPRAVCPAARWYEVALAPPMAARALGRPRFAIADLVDELRWPGPLDVGLVEGVGGPRSPLAADGDTVDLAAAVGADAVVLVADAGLGTIHAIRLAAPALAAIAPLTVVLNRYDADDELHRANRAWLAERERLAVVDSVDALSGRITARSLS